MSADMGMEDSLAPYIQRRFHSQNWFCYEVRPDQPLEITVYRAEDGARDVLSHYVQELFLQRRVNGKWEDSDKTLEDLCFFDRESRLFFGTVTHETLCYIYPPDRAFEEMLSQNQYWIAEPDIGQQQIDLRNFVSG